MATIIAEYEAPVSVPAARVYGVIADYKVGHPSILPKEYFGGLDVESGGEGEGTVIRYTMKLMGREIPARARVVEPQPGRVLQEISLDSDAVTTFTVTPSADNATCTVHIHTRYVQGGIGGWLAKRFLPAFLLKVYRAEVAQLERVANTGNAPPDVA